MKNTLLLIVLLIAGVLALSGCGRKGALTLPKQSVAVVQPTR